MIENKLSRRITLFKHRRGLLKKAFEVANICNQYVYVALYDKEYNTMTQFSSHKEFPLEKVVHHIVETNHNITGSAKNKKLKTVTPEQLMHNFYKEDDNEEMEKDNQNWTEANPPTRHQKGPRILPLSGLSSSKI